MDWAYGVTTVPDRFSTTLPGTISSLRDAGFPTPTLFIDSCVGALPECAVDLPVVWRGSNIGAFGNWALAAWELLLRNPEADRFLICQDDFVMIKNLREYLEVCDMPKQSYWNLYTYASNHRNKKGWQFSNHRGWGAVCLCFSNKGLRELLRNPCFVNWPNGETGHKRGIDKCIIDSYISIGYREFVHNPSLVRHTGQVSSIGSKPWVTQSVPAGWQGDDFDARQLIGITNTVPAKPKTPKGRRRIGLVGYNVQTGLGNLNHQIVEHCEIDSWLVRPHSQLGVGDEPVMCDVTVCREGGKIEEWVKSNDVVVFAETPYYHDLVDLCVKHNKRIVCIPMIEWLPQDVKSGWPKLVDLFICPTLQCYNMIRTDLPCVHFPWPVDTDKFAFKHRTIVSNFLFINGHGGWKGRKGGHVIKEALKLWPEMPLFVRSQTRDIWPGADHLPTVEDNKDLYDQGDVLLAPHCVDGIGLEILEAMSSGMPVLSTDGPPWDELYRIDGIPATSSLRKVRRDMHWYEARADRLVEMCKYMLGTNVGNISYKSRIAAEERSWNEKHEELTELIRTGGPR